MEEKKHTKIKKKRLKNLDVKKQPKMNVVWHNRNTKADKLKMNIIILQREGERGMHQCKIKKIRSCCTIM